MIASADGPITLNADSAGVKKLERLAGG
jgi:hypothetical protein